MVQFKPFVILTFVIVILGLHNSVFAQDPTGIDQAAAYRVYYNIAGQDVAQTTSWTSQADGKGRNPQNFAADSMVFVITSDVILSAQWSVSGQDSKIVVWGNEFQTATLVLLPGSQLNALVEVGPSGQLNVLSDYYPRWGLMHEGSTVVFSLDKKIIPYHDFYNLTFLGITPVFEESADNTVSIRGSLKLEGEVVFPAARNAVAYIFLFHGNSSQQINTQDNILRAWNILFEKTEGVIRLMPNTMVSADNLMHFSITEEALFQDNSATFYVGNHLKINGSESNFDWAGTFIMASKEMNIVDGAGAQNTYTIALHGSTKKPVALPNVIIRANNRGGEFRFECPSESIVNIKGNLLVEKQAAGTIRFCSQGVKIHGDYIVEKGFRGQVDPFKPVE